MKKIIDVSMDIFPGMVVWPGDERVELRRIQKLEDGARSNVSALRCGVHTGTHVDAPFHFLLDGRTIEHLLPEILIGPAWVAEFPDVQRIGAKDLDAAGIPSGTKRLLLKTDNSRCLVNAQNFSEEYAGLDDSGAEWVKQKGIRLLGNDYLSVACRDQTGQVHTILLGAGVILVEGLVLGEVPPGNCRLYCLPLKLRGSDGAPARALVEVESM